MTAGDISIVTEIGLNASEIEHFKGFAIFDQSEFRAPGPTGPQVVDRLGPAAYCGVATLLGQLIVTHADPSVGMLRWSIIRLWVNRLCGIPWHQPADPAYRPYYSVKEVVTAKAIEQAGRYSQLLR